MSTLRVSGVPRSFTEWLAREGIADDQADPELGQLKQLHADLVLSEDRLEATARRLLERKQGGAEAVRLDDPEFTETA